MGAGRTGVGRPRGLTARELGGRLRHLALDQGQGQGQDRAARQDRAGSRGVEQRQRSISFYMEL